MKKILLPFFCLFAFYTSSVPCLAQDADAALWGTDGSVHTICRSGNTIYVGGNFGYVGPNIGSGTILNGADGTAASTSSLQIAGATHITIPDGKGGWYIGGRFTAVQGKARSGLAHLLPDGKLDPAWNPTLGNTEGYGAATVQTMSLAGNTLFIGGMFTTVHGQPRGNIAALDATTGQLKEWQPANNPAGANAMVHSMVASGNLLYVGGAFTYIGEVGSPHFAALDAVTGEFISGAAQLSNYDFVHISAIAVANDRLYIGGSFDVLGSSRTESIIELNLGDSEPFNWLPFLDGPVHALAVSGDVLYAGGEFTAVDGQHRNGIVALDLTNRQVMEWNLQPDRPGFRAYTSALAVSGRRVYASGSFINQDGLRTAESVTAFDIITSQPVKGWNFQSRGMVRTLAVAGNSVFVGGDFTTFGGEARNNVAAIDALTGRLTPWNPDVKGSVLAMAVQGEKVYIGGSFDSVGRAPRNNLAAIDKVSGTVTGWQPEAGAYGNINAIVLVGQTIFAGGNFATLGGEPRSNLAAVNAENGKALNWGPAVDGTVYALAASGSTVYVGGMFTSVGGQGRSNLAAIDTMTRQVTAWNPGANVAVRALAMAENTLYVGGDFDSIAGQSRHQVAALDPVTGRAAAWRANGNNVAGDGYVTTLAVAGNTLYVGGAFTSIGGVNRSNLAALNTVAGRVTPWNPDLTYCSPLIAMAVHEGIMYVSGRRCTEVENRPVAGLAALRTEASNFNYISGNIFEDGNGNCTRDDGEGALANALVVAKPGSIFAATDSLGNYTLAVDPGSYTISQIISEDQKDFTRQVCPVNAVSHTAQFSGLGATIAGKNFANQVDHRPSLSISVSSNRRRRCFTGVTTVTYRNAGTAAASQAKVYLKLPQYVVPVSASVPFVLDKDKNFVFDLGTLAAGAVGSIQLTDSVVCNDPDIRGLAQCTRAWITPANTPTPGPEWDGSDITLKARCVNNGRVRLGIYNTGTGSMADSSAYRVYLDAQLAFTRNFKLAKGDSLVLQVPANGRTVRLEADQRPGHPTKQSTNVTLEACGTNAQGQVSLGFVAQLPADDAEPEVAEECLPITDSFDPNDKAVSPAGVTDQHYTPTRSRLDYVIRFQNTGTDVAYKVVVVDTLSEHLDVSTLQVGAVSHPYKMQVSGKGRPVLTFTFNNIMLPDSNANEPASHGYIQLGIKPKADLPEKTRIENFADIFFDYNEPVRTNTTFNTLYDLPPVPAEAVKLDGTVVCVATNTTATAGSSRTVCGQDTVVLAAILPAQGSGRWQRIGGTGTVTDPENPAARVTGLAYGNNGFEWRVAANTCGTDSLAGRVTITRLRQPAAPAITQRGADSLACSVAAGSYEWYFEGSPLGLRTRVIKATQPGKYAVRVNGENGCHSEPSPAFAWLPTALEPNLASLVRVYPNPTTGAFVVVLPPDLGQPVQVTLSDPVGRALAVRTLPPGTRDEQVIEFDLSAGRKGVYLLKLQTAKGVVVRKVCRQ